MHIRKKQKVKKEKMCLIPSSSSCMHLNFCCSKEAYAAFLILNVMLWNDNVTIPFKIATDRLILCLLS